MKAGSQNGSNDVASDGVADITDYFGLSNPVPEEAGKTGKAGSIAVDIEKEGEKGQSTLHILRAYDEDQLKVETYFTCLRLLQDGYSIVPVRDLSTEHLISGGTKKEIYVIWEGRFGSSFRRSPLILGLSRGKQISGLQGKHVILSLSDRTYGELFLKKERGNQRELPDSDHGNAGNLRVGFFFLGLSILIGITAPASLLVGTGGYYSSFRLLGYASIVVSVAGLITLAFGNFEASFPFRKLLFIVIAAFLANYSFFSFAPLEGISAVGLALIAGTVYSVLNSTIIFAVPLLTKRSPGIFALAGVLLAMVYIAIADIQAFYGAFPVSFSAPGLTFGHNGYFSYALGFLNFQQSQVPGVLQVAVFVAASVLLSVPYLWIALSGFAHPAAGN